MQKKISDKSTIIIQKEKLEHKQLHITGGLLKNEFLKRLLKEALNEAAIELIYEERENTYGACEMLKAGVF